MRGDGSIVQARDDNGKPRKGVWRVTVSGRDALTGERRRRTRIIRGSKADARAARDALVEEAEGGFKPRGAEAVTFGEYARQWLERRQSSGEYAERTLGEAKSMVRTLTMIAGDTRLAGITPLTVEAIMQAVKDAKRKPDGTTITGRTLLHYYTHLSMVLADGVRLGVIRSNPCDSVRPPKPEPSSRKALDADEAARLRGELDAAYADAAEAPPSDARIYLMARLVAARVVLATGLRLGEVTALQWSDIPADGSSVTVSRALTFSGNIKEPKSQAAYRTVSLGDDAARTLTEWKAAQAAHLADAWTEQTPIVSNPEGGYTSQTTLCKWFRKFCDARGFAGVSMHALRHTQATQLAAANVDIKTIQHRLGHSDPRITLGVYAHALSERDEEAAQVIERVLSPRKKAAIRRIKSA